MINNWYKEYNYNISLELKRMLFCSIASIKCTVVTRNDAVSVSALLPHTHLHPENNEQLSALKMVTNVSTPLPPSITLYKIIHLGKICNMLMSHCKYDTWLIYANYDRINNRSNTLKNEEY